jgi:hypothetical protein
MSTESFKYNYLEDGMAVHKNISFLESSVFNCGYARAVKSSGFDFGIRWRFHTCLWAAQNALNLEGDFVECGVGKGFNSSGIMEALDWDQHGRNFYLFDTFTGLEENTLSQDEKEMLTSRYGGIDAHNKTFLPYYAESYELVKENFSQWKNVTFVPGVIPDTLQEVSINAIAYLHIDLNCVMPEIESIKFFWDKLLPGAVVVLDDYAYIGYELQNAAWNEWSQLNQVPILSLPTGQGLFVKC